MAPGPYTSPNPSCCSSSPHCPFFPLLLPVPGTPWTSLHSGALHLLFPLTRMLFPTASQFLLPSLQVSVQKFPSQLNLPSRTGSLICGTQSKVKMQGPLIQKILIKALRNPAAETLFNSKLSKLI